MVLRTVAHDGSSVVLTRGREQCWLWMPLA
jgi:hypothetical protein